MQMLAYGITESVNHSRRQLAVAQLSQMFWIYGKVPLH